MNLAALQQEFMDQVLNDDRAPPPAWNARMAAGLDIYRNAYRVTMVAALRETFPKTALWVGDDAFAQAAAHHVITCPPRGWTLDLVGEGFAETLAGLFAADRDVADLAWLEWAMHRAFTARNCLALDTSGFAAATSSFGEEDWAAMRLAFMPTFLARAVGSDCVALWRALADGEPPASARPLDEPAACLVWREGLTPVFRLSEPLEAHGLRVALEGGSFGDLCAALQAAASGDDVATTAGTMLGKWLAEGHIFQVS